MVGHDVQRHVDLEQTNYDLASVRINPVYQERSYLSMSLNVTSGDYVRAWTHTMDAASACVGGIIHTLIQPNATITLYVLF